MLLHDLADGPQRWELYRLLSEPLRLKLLALSDAEELAVGELAELVREGQPNVSRHVATLRKAGLLLVRRQGTRAFVRARGGLADDPVLADGLLAGRQLCQGDGSLARVAEVVAARDAGAREFFAREPGSDVPADALPAELPAYLKAVGAMLPRFRLAVDAGTGDGSLLDAIAPLSDRVLAVDREKVRLGQAEARAQARGYAHVEFLRADYDADAVRERVCREGGADAVFASRVLHHAPKPVEALQALAGLLSPGGALLVIDYDAHDDEAFRERQADLWLGFSAAELTGLAARAGLVHAHVVPLTVPRPGMGPDAALDWHALIARAPRRDD